MTTDVAYHNGGICGPERGKASAAKETAWVLNEKHDEYSLRREVSAKLHSLALRELQRKTIYYRENVEQVYVIHIHSSEMDGRPVRYTQHSPFAVISHLSLSGPPSPCHNSSPTLHRRHQHQSSACRRPISPDNSAGEK